MIAEAPPATREPSPALVERIVTFVGVLFYIAGSAAFIGIAIAFFALHLYDLSSGSRIAFIVLYSGLFFAFQGLIFILVARTGELKRHNSYVLSQVAAMHASSAPGPPAEPGGE